MESERESSIERLRALIQEGAASIAASCKDLNRTYWVGLAGIPGAGKSTLGSVLSEELEATHGLKSVVVPMDGYHYSKRELDQMEDPSLAHFRRGAQWTFNASQFVHDIEACQQHQAKENQNSTFAFPSWNHDQGDPGERDIIVSGLDRVAIVEGNYLLLNAPEPWPQVPGLMDEMWLIEVPIDVAVERVCKRNAKAFGWTIERTLERTLASDKLNMEEILACDPKSRAHRLISNY